MSRSSETSRRLVRKSVVVAMATVFALLTANTTFGALVGGSLPTAGFTFTSETINSVHTGGRRIHLKTRGTVDVKTTYSRVTPSPTFEAGWHYHQGPVIVTVTVGVLTFFDKHCRTWDLTAGQTYIESRHQVLNAKVLPEKNPGLATVEWFTTRLYPRGAADPVPVATPCTP